MATSLQSLRQTLSNWMGDLRTGTADSGNANKLTCVDAALADIVDDYYIGWYIKMTSGSSSGDVRRISDFVQSTGTITVYAVFTAQIVSGETYELHKYNPDLKDEALKRTIKAIYPNLFVPWVDENLITGNWLRDGGLEEWSSASALVHWAKLNANSVLAQGTATNKLFGTYAARHSSAAVTGGLEQSEVENPRLLDLRGQTVTFQAWCKVGVASNAVLQVVHTNDKGVETSTSGTAHSGNNLWQLLKKEVSLPSNIVELSFQLLQDTLTASGPYYDHARVTGPANYWYYLPRSGWQDLSQVFVQRGSMGGGEVGTTIDPCDDMRETWPWEKLGGIGMVNDGTDKMLHIPYTLGNRYRLRLVGRQLLTVPTTDAGTTELNAPETDYLLAEALGRLYTMLPEGRTLENIKLFLAERVFWQGEAKKYKAPHFMPSPPSGGILFRG